MKMMLALALFCSAGFAEDGNQGSGGRNCDPAVQATCDAAANLAGEPEDVIIIDDIIIEAIGEVIFLLG